MSRNKLIINSYTWDKNNYQLFDYQEKNLIRNTLTVQSEGSLNRLENEIFFSDKKGKLNQNKLLASQALLKFEINGSIII